MIEFKQIIHLHDINKKTVILFCLNRVFFHDEHVMLKAIYHLMSSDLFSIAITDELFASLDKLCGGTLKPDHFTSTNFLVINEEETINNIIEIFDQAVHNDININLILWTAALLGHSQLFESLINKFINKNLDAIDLNFHPDPSAGIVAECSLAARIAALPKDLACKLELILVKKRLYTPCLKATPRTAYYLFKYAISEGHLNLIRAIINYESYMNMSLPNDALDNATPFEMALYISGENTLNLTMLFTLCPKPNFNHVSTHPNRHRGCTLLWQMARKGLWADVLNAIKKHKDLHLNFAPAEGDDKYKTIAVLAAIAKRWEVVNLILDIYYRQKCENPKLPVLAPAEAELIIAYLLPEGPFEIVIKIMTYFPKTNTSSILQFIADKNNDSTNPDVPRYAKLLAFHGEIISCNDNRLSESFFKHFREQKQMIANAYKQIVMSFFSDSTLMRLPFEIRELIAIKALLNADPDLSILGEKVLQEKLRQYRDWILPMSDWSLIIKLCINEFCKNNNYRFKTKVNIANAEIAIKLTLQKMTSLEEIKFNYDLRQKIIHAIGAKQTVESPKLDYEWCEKALAPLFTYEPVKNKDAIRLG